MFKNITQFVSFALLSSLGIENRKAWAHPNCDSGMCEVFTIVSSAEIAQPGNALSNSGNITIVDPSARNEEHKLVCRASAEVPAIAWEGVNAMLDSVKNTQNPPSILNNAQQVMILFYASIQDILKDFSCSKVATKLDSLN